MTRTELLVWFYRRRNPNHGERALRPAGIWTLRKELGYGFEQSLEGLIDLGAIIKTGWTYEVSPAWQRGLGVSGQSRVLGESRVRTYRSSESASLNGTREPVKIADGLWSSTPLKSGLTASTAHISEASGCGATEMIT